MNSSRLMHFMIVLGTFSLCPTYAQQPARLADNAALRYWSAFAQMQDSAITDEEAKELNRILDGTAPFDDAKYKDLVERNKTALGTLARANALPYCDWGIEYQLGPDTPVDYVRKALTLGRINVLYAFHLLVNGDKDGAVRTLAAGIRFSHNVANGGTLFATVIAKNLLAQHLKAIDDAIHLEGLSPAQRLVLQKAVAQLPAKALDWQSAVRRELEILQKRNSGDAAMPKIIDAYLSVLEDASSLPQLQQLLAKGHDEIPNPKRVLDEETDLIEKLRETRSLLKDLSSNADARSSNSGHQ